MDILSYGVIMATSYGGFTVSEWFRAFVVYLALHSRGQHPGTLHRVGETHYFSKGKTLVQRLPCIPAVLSNTAVPCPMQNNGDSALARFFETQIAHIERA